MRSAIEDMDPCAQHDPQYCGMCWFRSLLTRFWPSTLRQSQLVGRAFTSTSVRDAAHRSEGQQLMDACDAWPAIVERLLAGTALLSSRTVLGLGAGHMAQLLAGLVEDYAHTTTAHEGGV